MNENKSLRKIISNTLWVIKLIIGFNPYLSTALISTQILTASTPFLRNKFFSQLIDSVIYQQNNWNTYFFIFIGFLILASIFSFLQNQLNRVIDTKLEAQLRNLFLSKVSQLDYQHLEGRETGNLISKVNDEFGWRIRQTLSNISNISINLISLIAITIILLPKYPLLWFLIFAVQIPQYLIERYWVQKSWRIYEDNSENQKLMWDLNYQLREKNYIGELRINNAVSYLFEKFKKIHFNFVNKRVDLSIQQSPSEIGLIILSAIVGAASLYVLINDVRTGIITIGLFTFYFQTIQQTADFFRGIVFSSVAITENSYHIGNFKKVMDLENKIASGTKIIDPGKPPLIEFINVSFKYPNTNRYIYKNLNLAIQPGEEVAIVGKNGAGKSTLIKLICRFYEPTEGQILINGVDLKTIKLDSWYEQLSYLAQEFNHYWNLSLRENIILGKPSIQNDQLVKKSLDKADAKFVNKYKKGLDTPLSVKYGGEEPSWGQFQKIAIARVFYRNSPILILDEPTASIDAISEAKIFDQLYKDIRDKTVIIVSHRFSTVRNAQRIIVIDKGQIVESGSHDTLIKKDGLYAKSFNLQAKGYRSG